MLNAGHNGPRSQQIQSRKSRQQGNAPKAATIVQAATAKNEKGPAGLAGPFSWWAM